MEGIKEIKRKDWSIAYNPKFEEYREKYKNIVSMVELVFDGEEVEGVQLRKIAEEPETEREYFCLNLGDEEFFIKKMPNLKQGGVDEFKAGIDAASRLSKKGLDKVKCIEYIFAYTDSFERYVVSKYDKDAENVLFDYLKKLQVAGKYDEYRRLEDRALEIEACLYDYGDIRQGNMGYNPETDEIIIFDLNLKSTSLVESSDDEL